MRTLVLVVMVVAAALAGRPARAALAAPFHQAELIFPQENWHNHSPCIVECPNGDLLACWYHGHGEKTDEVIIEGARKAKGKPAWSARFLMADTPNYPDHNPCMIIDPQKRLWLFWPNLLANRWETAITKYKISRNYQKPGPPVWAWQDLIYVTPTNFEEQITAGIERYAAEHPELVQRAGMDKQPFVDYARGLKERAKDKLQQRLGWMTRVHPLLLPSGRLIVPLYSDNFDISIMALTDDWGKTWQASTVLMGVGNVQPSVVRKNDGTLVAMMRENGLLERIRRSESKDEGMTWGPVESMDLPNPGSSVEVIRLQNGHWALIYNDTTDGRHSLAVSISGDEGKAWKWTRHLEQLEPGKGSAAYPSLIQARDGRLHALYRYEAGQGSSIKHAGFNEEWVTQGDAG